MRTAAVGGQVGLAEHTELGNSRGCLAGLHGDKMASDLSMPTEAWHETA
jgi:hypothetical protein